MNKMLVILALLLPVAAYASSDAGVPLDHADIDISDKKSLQRGAKYFVNYCLSCHSAAYMRYNRMGKDLQLSDQQVEENLMFAADKIGATMTVAMPAANAKQWFGVAPPDLTVIARARGVDWLYTYLRTFYLDSARPFGVNNLVYKDVAMPHVLGDLQGWQRPVYKTETDADGHPHQVVERLEVVVPGQMTVAEYDRAARDLVAFLAYMGEPAQLARKDLGINVILFLLLFLGIAYLLKKEFWKDVH